MPSASGLSGPTTVSSTRCSCAKASSFGRSSAPIGTHSTAAPLAGQTFLRNAGVARRAPQLRGVRRLGQLPNSACSRPPEPITKIFIGGIQAGFGRIARTFFKALIRG